ncbi:MAG: AraC family transcriptional regulator [Planctomycetes bacterium]|nr:AraC family transcriptional regulator [Planctomycetota bacterium]
MKGKSLNALAVRRTDLPVSQQQQILCLLNTADQPWSTAYEFHYPLELGIVLRGRMRRIFNDHEAILEPGDLWFCGMWEPHGYEIVERPCHRLVLIVHPPLLAETRFEELPGHNWLLPFTVPARNRPQVAPADRPEMLGLADRLRTVAEGSGPQRLVRLRLLLWETLLVATRDWQPPRGGTATSPDDFGRVRKAIDAVFASRQRINTQQAAHLCGLSRNRFSDMFRNVTGISFADFALRYRLSGAARQLACTDAPLKAVADDWGFTDVSHLCRAFQAHYGQPPTAYRRQAGRATTDSES